MITGIDSPGIAGLSRARIERCLQQIAEPLNAMRSGARPEAHHVVWPAELPRSVLRELPLQVRTANCIRYENLWYGHGSLTVALLMSIPNFGMKSLLDLLMTVQDYLRDALETAPPDVESGSQTKDGGDGLSRRATYALHSLLAATAELRGTTTLGEFLAGNHLDLAHKLGISRDLINTRIDALVAPHSGPLGSAAQRLERALAGMSDVQRTVVEYRLACTPPRTLDAASEVLDVSRERVRQIQVKAERAIREALGASFEYGAAVVADQLDPIMAKREFERSTMKLWVGRSQAAQAILQAELIAELDYRLEDDFYIDASVPDVLERIRSAISDLADDVGLVDEGALVDALPNPDWHRFWPWLRDRCGLFDLGGVLTVRNSAKARTKAALISMDRPATRFELSEVSGLDVRQVSGALSNIVSIVRADRERWALAGTVEHEYKGIVGEITRRIDEGGGSTTRRRLLDELTSRFGVSRSSVYSYLQLPIFHVQDGRVSLAKSPEIRLRDLDEVIDGRDRSGRPYWMFVVDARFLSGYSITGVPWELAAALGCKPDGALRVRTTNLPGCPELSVRWRLTSISGASIGYLAHPLRLLEAVPGDSVRLTVGGVGTVELTRVVPDVTD